MELTPLAIAALGLLGERDMHPYEMFQTLIARSEDRLVKVRPGTLYHAVDRLAQQQLVAAVGTARAGNRPERTTYHITAAGSAALRDWVRATLAVPRNEYPIFPVAISEAHTLPAAEAVALLERRLTALREDADLAREATAITAAKGVDERFVLDAEYVGAVLETEIAWLDRLAARIRSGDIDWPDPTGAEVTSPASDAAPSRGTRVP